MRIVDNHRSPIVTYDKDHGELTKKVVSAHVYFGDVQSF